MRSLGWVPIQCAWCLSKEMGTQTHTEGRPRPAVYTLGRDQRCAHLGLGACSLQDPQGIRFRGLSRTGWGALLCRQNKHADPVRKREGVRTPSPVCVSIPCDGGGGGCPIFLWGKNGSPFPTYKTRFQIPGAALSYSVKRCVEEVKFIISVWEGILVVDGKPYRCTVTAVTAP